MDNLYLLTARDVAKLFGVDRRTVAAWAKTGRISHICTPGGRAMRFSETEARALLAGKGPDA